MYIVKFIHKTATVVGPNAFTTFAKALQWFQSYLVAVGPIRFAYLQSTKGEDLNGAYFFEIYNGSKIQTLVQFQKITLI
jgi:hypothetical protein